MSGSSPTALSASWWRTATLDNQPYLRPTGISAAREALDWHADARANIVQCQKWIEAAGMDVFSRRARVPTWRKAATAARIMVAGPPGTRAKGVGSRVDSDAH